MKKYWLIGGMALVALSGCGGGGGGSGTSTYTVTTSAGTGGSISPAAARVGEGETMPFTITPDTHYIIHTVSGCGGSLSGSTYTTGPVTADCTVTASFYPAPVNFTDGQAASVVIGQADFTSSVQATTQSGLNWSEGNATVVDGALYLPDWYNHRILGFNAIPTTNGASADFVIGASDFTSTGSLSYLTDIADYEGRLFVLESDSRIAVYAPVPTAATTAPLAGTPQTPAFYLTATGAGGFHPSLDGGVSVGGGKLVATDCNNHRVLIWNSVPSADTAPDLVLGQADFTGGLGNRNGAVAADTLQCPDGAWTDGERLVVMDSQNYRLLIWNSFPTSNGQAADLVLGQADFTSNSANRGATTAANTLGFSSYGVFVSGNQLFVTDGGNNRVLIWNSWPTVNGQAADNVLGQADFTASGSATTATGLNWPGGVSLLGTQLIVTDCSNSRYLIYNGSY